MKVFFRVDSSDHIGSGHLMRCLTLAKELRDQGSDIRFICRELSGNLIGLIQKSGILVSVHSESQELPMGSSSDPISHFRASQERDASQTIALLKSDKPDWLVVDHYGIDGEWEKSLSQYCGRIMAIDDLANRHHYCHILLDQNYSLHNELRYESLVPPFCSLLLGPSYALLQKEFEVLRQQRPAVMGDLKKILVFFTAGEDQGETLKAMKGIEIFSQNQNVVVDVVVGSANKNKAQIEAMCAMQKWGFHCQINYMPSLIVSADLVVGAGGSSSWERCALGTPALITILAENQSEIAQELHNVGAAISLGWNAELQAEDYARTLRSITSQQLASMSMVAYALVDGGGTRRVVKKLMI